MSDSLNDAAAATQAKSATGSANQLAAQEASTQEGQLDATENLNTQTADVPEFGLVDVVEAFTAMRHEWRGQSKESRAVAEAISAAAQTIAGLEEKLQSQFNDGIAVDAQQLAAGLAETEHQLSRATDAIRVASTNRTTRDQTTAEAIRAYFDRMPRLARWFARPLLTFTLEQLAPATSAAESTEIEGMNLVLGRLRGTMKQLGIERHNTVGEPFDAAAMNAIAATDSSEYPPGHVAEQLAPGYRWRGRQLRFAEVIVAANESQSVEH